MLRIIVTLATIVLLCAACTSPTPVATPIVSTVPSEQPSAVSATPSAMPATPSQTPQAPRIFYTSFNDTLQQAEIHSMALDGGDDRTIARCPGRCAISGIDLSPDGGRLAYVTEPFTQSATLHIIDLASGDDRIQVEHFLQIMLVGFSPDGSRLAYVLSNESEIFGLDGSIWVQDADGQQRRVLERIHPLGITAWLDDDHLIFGESDGLGQVGMTYRLPIDPAGPPEPLVKGTLRALAPDRNQVLIGTEAIGHDIVADQPFDHLVVGLDSQPPTTLQSFAWTAGAALWSPNGEQILHTGTQGIELLSIADGTITLLERTSPKDGTTPSTIIWAADGRSLLYAMNPPGTQHTEIHRRSLDSSEDQMLTSFSGAYSIVLLAE